MNIEHHGSESFSNLGLKGWNIIPLESEQNSSLTTSKESINLWKPLHCLCRLCKSYVNSEGFF